MSIGEEAGRLRSQVIGYFVPMSVIRMITNLASGWSSARTRLKWHLFLMNVAAFVGVLGTIHLETALGKWGFIVGNGICGGFFASVSGVVWPRFYGRQWLGAISGVGMSSMVIASGLGPLMFSLSQRFWGSYAPILWLSGLVPASLLVASFWADNPQRRLHDEPPLESD